MVSIAAFQAVDPGSIPGRRIALFIFCKKKFLSVSELILQFDDEKSNNSHLVSNCYDVTFKHQSSIFMTDVVTRLRFTSLICKV